VAADTVSALLAVPIVGIPDPGDDEPEIVIAPGFEGVKVTVLAPDSLEKLMVLAESVPLPAGALKETEPVYAASGLIVRVTAVPTLTWVADAVSANDPATTATVGFVTVGIATIGSSHTRLNVGALATFGVYVNSRIWLAFQTRTPNL